MDDRDERIADIALFFYKDSEEKACWISEKLYTSPEFLFGPTQNGWRDSIVSKLNVKGAPDQPAYLTNLANLDPPGSPPTPEEDKTMRAAGEEKLAHQAKQVERVVANSGDIFIVPFAEPDNVYRIPKDVYENPRFCPEVKMNQGSDLHFMAKTEGVVLANVPKVDLAGLSCYVLNLRALRNSRTARR